MDPSTTDLVTHLGPLAVIVWAELRLLPRLRRVFASVDAIAAKVGVDPKDVDARLRDLPAIDPPPTVAQVKP